MEIPRSSHNAQLSRIIQVSAFLVCALTIVLAALHLWRGREQALTEAGDRVKRAAGAIEVNVNRTLVALDMTLAETGLWVREYGVADRRLQRLLRSVIGQNLLLRDVMVLSADGRVLVSGRRPDAQDAAPAALPSGFLANVVDSRTPMLRFSAPVVNPLTSQAVWYLARPVSVGDGAVGAIVAEVQLDLLSAQLKPDSFDDLVVATLEDGQGQLIASSPAMTIGLRRDIPPLQTGGTQAAVADAAGRLRGERTLLATRPSLYSGLYFSAGMAYDEALMDWRRERWFIVGIALAILMLSGLYAWVATRSLERMRQARAELVSTRDSLSATLAAIPDHLLELDAEGRCLAMTAGQGARFFADPSQWPGRRLSELMPEAQARLVMDCLATVARSGHCLTQELDQTTATGTTWFELSFAPKPGDDGQSHIIVIARDVSERKKAVAQLQLAASVFGHALEGIMITDPEGVILDVNERFCTTLGYTKAEVLGRKPNMLKSDRQDAEFYAQLWRAIQTDGRWTGEVWNRRKNGEVFPELETISAVRDAHGRTQYYVALYTDISQLKQQQLQLERIAHFDVLTNLPNRVLLFDRLRQALLVAQRQSAMLAVVYLDLDGFKLVNDSYGHRVGDDLLVALSLRLKLVLRQGDTLARIGGDEFVAVLSDLSCQKDCEPILERLLEAASQPYAVGALTLQVSASIGVAINRQGEADADLLLRQADQAMYLAKEAGKNRWHFFDVESAQAAQTRRDSVLQVRAALDRNELILHYQPKVNLRTGGVVGVEALIRWQHPERGQLSPMAFLPLVEHDEVSVAIGEWVIRQALLQTAHWRAAGLDLEISVNIGAVQLQQSDFPCRLDTLLRSQAGASASRLQLEVLETSALEDMASIADAMTACHSLGVSFALDDFGTGYSSLTHLRRLPAQTLKIDQSFVRDMLVDTDDLAIVQGIIGLANVFQRQVVAEGVETAEHGERLLAMGCEVVQGFGIAAPMPPEDLLNWVDQWQLCSGRVGANAVRQTAGSSP